MRRLLFVLLFVFQCFVPGAAQAVDDFHESGELLVAMAQSVSGDCQPELSLKFGDGLIVSLLFIGPAPESYQNGDHVEVIGERTWDPERGEAVLVSEMNPLAIRFATVDVVAAAVERKVLLIRVNFADATVGCSATQISDLMWNATRNVNGMYQEASYGLSQFPADTNGNGQPDIVDVTLSSTVGSSCSQYTWAAQADTAAQALGADLDLYDHIVYVLPQSVPCSWAGLATVGGGSVWVSYCALGDVYTHELGHNLGLLHASCDVDNNGAMDSGGDYCDYSCPMGIGGVGWRHFNAPHKVQLGWVPSARKAAVSADGNYELLALEPDPEELSPAPATSVQVLTAPAPSDRSGYLYFISYRVQSGSYSANLQSKYAARTNIHWGSLSKGRSYFVKALADGETWDDGNGVSITQLSHSGNIAVVRVSVPGGAATPTPTSVPAGSSTPTPTVVPTGTPGSGPTAAPTRNAPPLATSTATPYGTSTPTNTPGISHRVRGRVKVTNMNQRTVRLPPFSVLINSPGTVSRRVIRTTSGGAFTVTLPAGRNSFSVVRRFATTRKWNISSKGTVWFVPFNGEILLKVKVTRA